MTFRQKVEIGAGFVTQLILLTYSCLLLVGFGSGVKGEIQGGIVLLAIPWLLSLLVAFGAYFHATKGSIIALIALCIGAFILITILGLFWLIFISWSIFSWIGLIFNIVTLAPIVSAGITLITAFSSQIREEAASIKRFLTS